MSADAKQTTAEALRRLKRIVAGDTEAPVGDEKATLFGDIATIIAHVDAQAAQNRVLEGPCYCCRPECLHDGCRCALLSGQPVDTELERLREAVALARKRLCRYCADEDYVDRGPDSVGEGDRYWHWGIGTRDRVKVPCEAADIRAALSGEAEG